MPERHQHAVLTYVAGGPSVLRMPEQQSHDTGASGWVFTTEAAKILGVSRQTLIRWADEGHVPSWRLGGSGHRRFDKDTLVRMRREAAGGAA